MLDLNHLSYGAHNDIQTFIGSVNAAAGLNWVTWKKPRGKTLACMYLCGSGAGGGGGFAAAAGSTKGGGGGGGSGGCSSAIYPLIALPDILYIHVPAGGLGGAGSPSNGSAASSGSAGRQTLICLGPYNNTSNIFLASGGTAPTGGAAGGSTGAAVGGNAGAAGPTPFFAGMAQFQVLAGQAGSGGGNGTGNNLGTSLSYPTTGIWTCAGIGGSSANSANTAGKTYTTVSDSQISETIPGAAASGASAGSGYLLSPPAYPFWSWGGPGGGGNNSTVGGDGGQAAPGSGGGGGGAGVGTGGKGGDGGPGLVIIICV